MQASILDRLYHFDNRLNVADAVHAILFSDPSFGFDDLFEFCVELLG